MADAKLGFSRPEMCTENLAGTAKAPFSRHVCVVWGKAAEWPGEVPNEFPDNSLPKKVDAVIKESSKASKVKAKIQLVEASGKLKDGDVLVFPDYVKISAKTDAGLAALKSFLSKARSPGTSRCVEDVEDLDSGFLLVCAHNKRDERCGYCGPELVKAFEGTGAAKQANLQVLKCSHVGGHVYAGNVIAYTGKDTKEGNDGHWYGYVTPADVDYVASGKAARSRLWRGRMGLDEAAAKRERLTQRLCDAAPLLALAASAVVVATVMIQRRKQ